MAAEIVNRVTNSALVTLDLEELYPKGKRVLLDIEQWLHQGLVLREKEFRAALKGHDWSQYKNSFVAIGTAENAIVPGWAFMLVATYLNPYAKKVVIGGLEDLETALYRDVLNDLDFSSFQDKPVIIKGCSDKPVPQNAYIMAIEKLQSVAKSLMYGEACSSVPLFKRKRS